MSAENDWARISYEKGYQAGLAAGEAKGRAEATAEIVADLKKRAKEFRGRGIEYVDLIWAADRYERGDHTAKADGGGK